LKTALVTGAAQGVGFAAAALLGRLGYGVVLLDVKPHDGQVRQLQETGTQAVGVVGDVASESFVRELAERVARDYGALDALVNNAGISLIAPA
jgi:NAD(P)-dependent dehydrogenase (short-subunit alcohol dehydrogenase family)